MSAREPWREVGSKIRYLRKTHQLTLKQLAAGCGLSPNAISLVERGEVAPTVVTLCKVAAALGTSASYFFQEICPNDVIVNRVDDYASDPLTTQAMSTLICGLPTRESTAEAGEQTPIAYSRESVLCLCGEIEYETDEKTYRLKPGDRLTFNGNAPHRWRNAGATAAVAVMIVPARPPAKSH